MLESIIKTDLTVGVFLICTAVSVALGIAVALVGMYRSGCTQSFAIALAVLPAVVQTVIMLVNGNIGAGVAVAARSALYASAPRREMRGRSHRYSSPWR